MIIDLRSVLWRTRGRHWDYTFVLRPITPHRDGWYDVHKQVFASLTPGIEPATCGGVFVCGNDKYNYMATTFLDELRHDIAGRSIAHYLIYFTKTGLNEPDIRQVPKDWGKQVVSSFDIAFDKIFEQPHPEYQFLINECIESRANDGENLLSVNGSAIQVSLNSIIEAAIPKLTIGDPRPDSFPQIPSVASDVSKRIMSAIIEGEAYALGFKGPIGSLKLLSQVDVKDKLQQLSNSFGGAPTDLFIRNRLDGLKSRVLRAKLTNTPRRGFDVLIQVLQSFPFDSTRQDYEQTISELLGASAEDLVVKNIVARLKSLKVFSERKTI